MHINEHWKKMGEISTSEALMQETTKIELEHPHGNQGEKKCVLTHIHIEEKRRERDLAETK